MSDDEPGLGGWREGRNCPISTRPMPVETDPRISARLSELRLAIGFLTRFPATAAAGRLAEASWAFPLAGLLVGASSAIVYALAVRLGLTALLAGALAVASAILTTGALHEDGLADFADALGVRCGPGAKLAAMRTSGIGSFGVLALIFAVGIKVVALAALTEPAEVAAALIAAHAGARSLLPWMMHSEPWARSDGLAVDAGRPSLAQAAASLAIGFAILLVAAGPARGLLAAAVALLALLLAPLARRQIGGMTGDVLGAAEQVAEIAILLALVASR
jgi:adenosylcobinamide-GDP ribazoletransferase